MLAGGRGVSRSPSASGGRGRLRDVGRFGISSEIVDSWGAEIADFHQGSSLKFLANLSIRNKVAGIILVATLLSLGTGFTLVILNNMRLFEQDLLRTTGLIARATGDYTAVYFQFEERLQAEEDLTQLEAFEYVTDAHLYDTSR